MRQHAGRNPETEREPVADGGVRTAEDGSRSLHLGIEAAGVLVCLALVAWRRNLFLGLAAGVALVAVARLTGAA